MPIQYHLVESDPSQEETSYLAQVQLTSTANLEVIASRMITKGVRVPKVELLPLLEHMVKAVEDLLIDGQRVNLGGLVDLSPRVLGRFETNEDPFDPTRHQLDVTANAGSRIRIAVRTRGRTRQVVSNRPTPTLQEYASSEGNGTLQGAYLKFDPSREDEGVYFLPVGGGTAIKVATIVSNATKKLVFKVPPLPSGQYQMEVRSRLSHSPELRTGRLPDPLTA